MDELLNRLGDDRITSRQIDELVGLARGIAADGDLNLAEVEFLQKWLAANTAISQTPVIRTLYQRINDMLQDGVSIPTRRPSCWKPSTVSPAGTSNWAKF